MRDQPVLSEAEWRLVLEMLERESYYLPVEIHHTYKRAYRMDLKNRLDAISNLVERVRGSLAHAEGEAHSVAHA